MYTKFVLEYMLSSFLVLYRSSFDTIYVLSINRQSNENLLNITLKNLMFFTLFVKLKMFLFKTIL